MNKVIIFDVDGTLFDTKPGIINALNEVLHVFKKSSICLIDEDKWVGPPVRESFKKYALMSEDQAELATKLYRQVYTEKYITNSDLYDGMGVVLKELKNKGYYLCIATMKTQNQIECLLALQNMKCMFDMIQTADLDGLITKSNMLAFIKSKFSNESKFYMVGDTDGDFEAASNVKMPFIFANYGYGLLKSNFGLVANTPFDILELLKE